MTDGNKFYLIGEIQIHDETEALKESASSVMPLPKKGDKQPDLLYMSCLFVSSGTNLNLAHFLPSELVKAQGTIVSKAVDVEHKEDQVIGAIYDRKFVDRKGEALDLDELSSMGTASIDGEELDIVIACVIYKSRFPKLAQEIAENKWCVSMEAFYSSFDLKIGSLIISPQEAEVLGLVSSDESIFGKAAKVIKNGAVIASGEIARVLRGLTFTGVGIVLKPANITSVVLETAHSMEKEMESDKEIILNYDEVRDKEDTSIIIDKEEESVSIDKEAAELQYDDTVGICVSYKKEIIDSTFKGPGTKVLHENWCTLYDTSCTSFSRDTTDPNCLKNKINTKATAQAKLLLKNKEINDTRKEKVSTLLSALFKAEKYL